ncbi:PAS/PAC sensor hybrid histidine kinase [Mariniphaga anaerophila]|uniref:histidine kinase n=1 Tax=Mariniphaga anaerophila TaxID=1484053 RepID=A0A1M4SPD0_9BACT|nr:PAS domain S-box protein [Mariniphaga anaerophila]SHE34032.1 PAS/PAC sensor hybrid histidine kinase [Mariniphaga anaerophila]
MYKKNQPIKILFVEDLPTDAEMARREIQKEGIKFTYRLVDSESDFRKELADFNPDIVVSDYSMPSFDGMSALKITRAHSPFLPFVVLTGSMNEETAVSCMKAGANDYVIKEQIKRLPFAVAETIEKSRTRIEKVRMQQQLQSSLEEYRDLINGMSETVWIFQPNGKLLDVNNTAVEILGYTREELSQKGPWGVNSNLTNEAMAKIADAVLNGKVQFFQTVHTTKAGKNIPVEVVSSLIKYRGEKAILSVVRDITDRIEIEDQLKLLSRSVEQSPVATIITNPEGTIEYVNKAFTKISGYLYEEAIGKTPRILKSGKHTNEFYNDLWTTIKSGKEWHGEMMNRNKSGEMYWADVSISPMLNSNGEITHFISVREDVTEKKNMIDNLVKAKEKAEESDRLKSAFLANMSHEIRTPMNGILGFTELLKEPKLSGKEQKEYIRIIQKSGERMLNTINDLIEISRIESGTLDIQTTEVNVNVLIDYLYNFFKADADKKGLILTQEKGTTFSNAFIKTDQEKLNKVFVNLIKNAIKYTHEGSVAFGYRMQDDEMEFFVKDTGIGIDKEQQKVVFERFVQADLSISKLYEGAGLGLSIAKAYIGMLGGEIWLQSEKSKGTQFFFTIPQMNDKTELEHTNSVHEPEAGNSVLNKLTILVAEDDFSGKVYLSELLDGKCKKLFFAENGEEAVRLFSEHPDIDLILMDIKMPEMNGFQATREIKKVNPEVVVIAQTACALSGDKEKAFNAGCNDYLTKPFSRENLLEMVTKYCT